MILILENRGTPSLVSARVDSNGVDLNPVQDTPVATKKEDLCIHFGMDVEIQRHLERLPKGDRRAQAWAKSFTEFTNDDKIKKQNLIAGEKNGYR